MKETGKVEGVDNRNVVETVDSSSIKRKGKRGSLNGLVLSEWLFTSPSHPRALPSYSTAGLS